LKLKIIDLKELPIGASFRSDSGRVHQTVTKIDWEELEFVSTCDSILLLVDELKIEVYHLSSDNTTFKAQLNERKEVIKREPTGFQWFQIYTGRTLAILLIGYLILRFRFKIKI